MPAIISLMYQYAGNPVPAGKGDNRTQGQESKKQEGNVHQQ